jgi:serine/threonine protein kinase
MLMIEKYPTIEILQDCTKGLLYVSGYWSDNNKKTDIELCLVKTYKKSETWYFIEDPSTSKLLPRELYFNKLINDESICPIIIDSYETEDQYIIAMEYLRNEWMDLFDYAMNEKRKESQIKIIFKNILIALNKLIKKGIYHVDMKPENVMVNKKTLEIKLIDFEDVLYDPIHRSPKCNDCIGTESYMSPEVYNNRITKLSKEFDVKKSMVYTLASLLYCCIESETPDEKVGERFRFYRSSVPARNFICKCTENSPNMRLKFHELLNHNYLKI